MSKNINRSKFLSMNKRKMYIAGLMLVCIILIFSVISVSVFKKSGEAGADETAEIIEEEDEETISFGIPVDRYDLVEDVIKSGESLSVLLGRYGVSARTVDSLVRLSDGVFDLKTIRGGNNYKAYISKGDSLSSLCHFIYERNNIDYVVFSFVDSLCIRTDSREIHTVSHMGEATISSSLWNAMVEKGMSPALAMDLSDIYAWSIDFFGIQKGDNFKVVYDEKYVDTVSVGVGTIWGAWFEHNGKRYYAIPFEQDGKVKYWDENGNSLRKNLLKAPLKFSRISSKFTNSRYHPVLKIYRPHHGVDYAAPAGTPVYAVADGTITYRAYSGQGGNTIKIKHARGLESAYLHLRGYAKGISVGKRVSQGELIGYVGSTGVSTGPHLDFRLKRNGTPMDPLKVPSEPAEPIADANRTHFEMVKSTVMAVLDGDSEPEEIMAAVKMMPEQFKTDSLAVNGR